MRQVNESDTYAGLFNLEESFIEAHVQAALGNLRAAREIADRYYGEQNPLRTACADVSLQHDAFLDLVSTRTLREAAACADGGRIVTHCPDAEVMDDEEPDAPYCHVCGARSASRCDCGPYASDH